MFPPSCGRVLSLTSCWAQVRHLSENHHPTLSRLSRVSRVSVSPCVCVSINLCVSVSVSLCLGVTSDDTFPLTSYEPNDTELIDTELNDSVPSKFTDFQDPLVHFTPSSDHDMDGLPLGLFLLDFGFSMLFKHSVA